ncbi:MAG: carboxypeptidase regulatory-like domain-containing protein [Bacteroidales bacterium]|nr:carboxypeptidase regulatory-like domain-containing protein [Bacteroidales bacterium]
MKKLFLIFIAAFAFYSAAAQIQFFPPQNISDEYGPSRDHAMYNIDDDFYLVWDQWGDLMFRKSTNGGLSWGTKSTIYNGIDYGAKYPVIAAANGNVFVFYYRNTTGKSQIFMLKSSNDGQSFGSEIQITDANQGAQVPQIAISGDTLVLAYEDRDFLSNPQIFIMKSVDAGQSWSASLQVSATTEGARWCNIALKGNQIFAFWNDQTGPNYDHLDLFFSKSTNFGQSWTSPQNLSNNQAYNARLKTKIVDNSIYTIVSSKIDGLQTDAILYRSNDLGASWEAALNLSDNSGGSERPDVYVLRDNVANHRIYAIWSDGSYSGNDKAVMRYSVDNGESWSEILPFSQDTEDASWPQINGYRDGDKDQLFMTYFRPHDGTFDYQVWGVRAENQLAENITFSGQVVDVFDNGLGNAKLKLNGTTHYTDDTGNFSIQLIPGTYNLTVSADGFIGFQQADLELTDDTALDFMLEALLFPPLNLRGDVIAQTVVLNWDEPASLGDWLYWDDGENSDAVGGENIDVFDAAIRFTPTDLQNYDGKYLTEISAYFEDIDADFSMRVWTGGNQFAAGNLQVDQAVENPIASEWNTIELNNPVLIDASQELWIGYRVQNTGGGYPAGTDNGPAVPFKGDMILYGADWLSMSDYFGWNINWNIRGFAVDAPGSQTKIQVLENSKPQNSGLPEKIAAENPGKRFRWEYTHFNVWRNFNLIAEVAAGEFTFVDEFPINENTYAITTARDIYESVASNAVTVEIVSLAENNTYFKSLTIFPNPVKTAFKLYFESRQAENMQLELSDLSGRLIYKDQIKAKAGKNEIDLNREKLNLTAYSGVIILKLSGKEQQFTRRIILE